jgi:hypothetical protein
MSVLPRIASQIERRLLVNYRVDADVAARFLPAPFRPQLAGGHAVAGICLIRLGSVRPAGLPARVGVGSENAAHRFSVEWDEPDGSVGTGVYVPRRDSSAWANVLLGGRLFPGVHHHARFAVAETADHLSVGFTADDGSASVAVEVELADDLTSGVFPSLDEASRFFEQGALGHSPARTGGFEALELRTSAWRVEPLRVMVARSSYFEDASVFPPGTAVLDHALLMREVPVTWHSGRS